MKRSLMFAVCAVLATVAQASIVATPNTVTVAQNQTSTPINLALSFSGPGFPGVATIAVTGMPPGVSTIPSPVTYAYTAMTAGATSTTSFMFNVGATSPVGTYTITLTDVTLNAGTTTVTLQVIPPPSFTANATPNPVTLQAGGSSQNVTVTTATDPGFTAASVTYSFSGFPGFISTGGSQTTNQLSGYAPVTFTFSAAAGAIAGTYTGTLTGTPGIGAPKTFPFTVVVQSPDIAASFTQPVINMCNGASASNALTLTPLNGYSGTPTLQFFNVPPGFILNPSNPSSNPLPPSQTVPFTINANGLASGPYTISMRITDAAASISKIASFTVVIGFADYTPSVTPSSVNMNAGGAPQTLSASVSSIGCFNSSVGVTVSAPSGLTVTPSSATAPATFTMQAGAALAAGTYQVTFNFTPASGSPKQVVIPVNVSAAPDFAIVVSPTQFSVSPGDTRTVTVSAQAFNGFSGTINVTAPVLAGVAFTPASFTLTAGGAQPVTMTMGSTVTPGALAGIFSATSPLVSGTRNATLSLNVNSQPDFVLTASPSALTVAAGSSGSVVVSATALNGFSQTVTVTGPSSASPSTFTLAPGASQTVTINVASDAAAATTPLTFTGTAGGVTRTANVMLTVSPRPDFSLAATPSAVSIPANGSTTVRVTATGVNGFTGPVNVTVVTSLVTATPSSFALLPGASQVVTLTAGPVATANPILVTFASGARTANVLVSVTPPLPLITEVVPAAVTTGTRSAVLRVRGNYFQNGATILPSNDLTIENVTILSPTLADVAVSVREDAAPGPRILRLRNPDGGTTAVGVTLLVYPTRSLAAPLGVTSAAIVFPAEGTIIAGHEAVYPRALLATTGVGTIIGSWQFDGVPFDRFVTTVSSGFPAEVRAHMPIPISFSGDHRLELIIETPQRAVAPLVNIIEAADSASHLQVYAPRDGSVVSTRTLFRWSLVPNTSGYLVEIGDDMKIRLAESQWRPTEAQLRALSNGIQRWRVRAVFPGDTPGEPTAWQRFVVTPDHVNLTVVAATANAVRWTGGVAGLLYRVDVIAPNGRIVFSALTSRDSYRLPVAFGADHTIRITALGPGGVILGTSSNAAITPQARKKTSAFIPVADLEVRKKSPTSPVHTAQPTIAAEWIGKVEPEEVSLMLDETDVTTVTMLSPTSASYTSLLPLNPGEHTVRLSLRGTLTTWTFKVEDGGQPPTAVQVPEGPTTQEDSRGRLSSMQRDWVLTPIGTLTAVDDELAAIDPRDARLQLSTQTDIANGAVTAKVTGDVALKHQFNDPNKTVQESRSWITNFGAKQGNFGEQAIIGYAGPDFLDQLELLTSGLARGGAEGKLLFPVGTTSYYESFNTTPTGVVAGNFGPQQKVRAFSYQLPSNQKWDLRLISLNVTDESGFNSAGGKGRAYGIFAKYANSPGFNVLVEAARGGFDPNFGSGERNRRGNGIRFGFSGTVGTFNYLATLRKTDADFVNPANRGFTPGGVPDRTGGTVALSKTFGRTSLSAQIRHLQDGNSSGAIVPKTRETGGLLNLTTMLGQRVSFSLGGNKTNTSGAAIASLFLPKSDRQQTGWNGTLTETLGQFAFAQAITFQQLKDAINPTANQKMTSALVTAGGSLRTWLTLAGVASATRNAGAANVIGTTNQRLLSLQPTISIPRLWISFQPRATYSHSENDLTHGENQSEAFQGLVSWGPPWLQQMVALQLSADWTRNKYTGQLTQPKFMRRYAATFSLHSTAGNGALATGPAAVVLPPTSFTPVTNQEK